MEETAATPRRASLIAVNKWVPRPVGQTVEDDVSGRQRREEACGGVLTACAWTPSLCGGRLSCRALEARRSSTNGTRRLSVAIANLVTTPVAEVSSSRRGSDHRQQACLDSMVN